MTAAHTLQPKPQTSKNTSFLNRFKHILAAARMKTTDPPAGKKTTLIKPYQSDQESFQHTETLYDISLPLSK
jgi:hypothetical protein